MTTTNVTDTAIAEATDAVVTAATKTPAKKAPAKKAPAKKATTKKTATKAPAKPEPKPEPVMLDGFEMKVTAAEAKAIQADAVEVAKAVAAIVNKDDDLFGAYMTFGKFASEAAPAFKSTKVYGQYLAKHAPESQAMDPALRSNCKWVYEALNHKEHEASDLLTTLGVNRIEDFKSSNPTVIKREYKAAQKKLELAKSAGVDVNDDEALAEAEAKAKEEAKADQVEAINKLRELVSEKLMKNAKRQDIADISAAIIADFYVSKSRGAETMEIELDITT